MAESVIFYDLETSGTNPRYDRIMQFAAQRTDMALQPIGQPYNFIIQLSPDVLPSPEAILVTGITPQVTLDEGITEAEFLEVFTKEIAIPNTTFVGFNSVRFDDEFMRFLHYRNFYDPYEWAWKDGKSRWDVLDLVRMTRALRPDGVQWPFTPHGTPTNRLELLTRVNDIQHDDAHDALSDVHATLAVAQLIAKCQPKLFDYLFKLRGKKTVATLVESSKPFVYSSGRYPSEFHKTTVAHYVGPIQDQSDAVVVFDLRHSPYDFLSNSVEELASNWKRRYSERDIEIPVKILKYNRCPAIAPLQVVDTTSAERIKIDLQQIDKHTKELVRMKEKVYSHAESVLELLQEHQQETLFSDDEAEVDTRLYEGFFSSKDSSLMRKVHSSHPSKLDVDAFPFEDERLRLLLPLYKARNFPDTLSDSEAKQWEAHRKHVLMKDGQNSRLYRFMSSLHAISQRSDIIANPSKQFLLQELQLYAESVVPSDI